MARWLATDARISLERAGYIVEGGKWGFAMYDGRNMRVATLDIERGTVDDAELIALLEAKNCDAYGRKRARFGGLLKDFQAQGRAMRPVKPVIVTDFSLEEHTAAMRKRAALAFSAPYGAVLIDEAAQDAIEGRAGNVGRASNETRY